ncbi:VOC family protein [Alicyclobacillus fastidiosus]|uniref:VOC family protein n=1 Tax=Alicyclobacillus fastidiosus TaxID=392011 RepID=A0ABV5AHL3_9BACL|nr:VOC family protein [Alicyclobacillus fastidiosus]WEH11531.1 VOC family protein [Alicyclobacillus fastidiosus]
MFEFDHLLHAVHNPEQARVDFSDALGVHTVTGGTHPQWGTYNSLCYFGLPYIEWISIRDAEIAKGTEFGQRVLEALAIAESPVQFAVRTSQMDAVAEAWRARGLDFDGPVAASRTGSDGKTISWRMLFPRQQVGRHYQLPFVIEWGESDEARRRTLENNGLSPRNRPYDLLEVHSVVSEIESFRARWSAYFSTPFEPVHDGERGEGLCVLLGEVRAYFWEPRRQDLSDVLERFGERPFELTLRSRAAGQSMGARSLLHGLAVRVAPAP